MKQLLGHAWPSVIFVIVAFCLTLACGTLQASDDGLSENNVTNPQDFGEMLSAQSYNFTRALDRSPGVRDLPSTAFAILAQTERARMAHQVRVFCEKVDARYKRFGWQTSPCLNLSWTFGRISELGHPLIYWEYSNLPPGTDPAKVGTTLVLGGVHADEITPVHVAFRFANALQLFPENYEGMRVIVAPLVNPDGFFIDRPTRTNRNGIDLNRNFPTRDWWENAANHWQKKRNKDARHFPGFAPRTEEGTRFQMDLLEHYEPDKVISIHAPLGFLDYDGPGDSWSRVKGVSSKDKRARELVLSMAKNSRNYKVEEFPIYPGSLGTYSGFERSIPTVTLELNSTDPRKVNQFWREFYPGLKAAIKFDFKSRYLANLETPCQSIFCSLIPPLAQEPAAAE